VVLAWTAKPCSLSQTCSGVRALHPRPIAAIRGGGGAVHRPPFPKKKKKEDDERQYMRQLSVLVNYSTLVSLLPTVAWTALALTQRQVGSLIKEAAGQVWRCFFLQFIRGIASATSGGRNTTSSSTTTRE